MLGEFGEALLEAPSPSEAVWRERCRIEIEPPAIGLPHLQELRGGLFDIRSAVKVALDGDLDLVHGEGSRLTDCA